MCILFYKSLSYLACANHHIAFDLFLRKFEPKKPYRIISSVKNIKVEEKYLKTLTGEVPHIRPLKWHYDKRSKR